MFHVHRKSSVPLTEQICREFSDRIRTGILEPGSRLPSVRELSQSLGVSLVTVVQSYRLLENYGYTTSVHGKGTFVRAVSDRPTGPSVQVGASLQPFDWQLAIADYLPRAAVLGQHGRTAGATEALFKMSTASLHPELSAKALPAHLYNVFRDTPYALSEYGPVEGIDPLRKEIAAYFVDGGMQARAEDILVTNGVQQAIDIVARTFIGPGDVVVVEAPTYAGAIDVFRARGATLVSIPMDDEGIRLDLLMKQCDQTPPKLVYTMPTYQNPTGIVMSARRRRGLLELSEMYQFLILEDDSFSDCSFAGPPPPPIRALDTQGNVIYVKGFSKVFCPGCRIASVVSSGSVRTRLVAAKSVSDLGSPVVTQLLMHACMVQQSRNQRVQEIALAVRRKRDIALKVLAAMAPSGVTWTMPTGGYNIWLTLPSHINTDGLLVSALQRGLSFLPGSACYANETVHHQLRISVAYLDDDTLKDAVTRLCALLTEVVSTDPDRVMPIV